MRNLCAAALIAAHALAAVPASASSSVSIRVRAVVPVSCEAGAGAVNVSDRRIFLSVRRTCNTGHSMVITAPIAPELGVVTVARNGQIRQLTSGHASYVEPERYYDGTDVLVVECSEGDHEAVQALARSLRVAVEVT